MKLKINFHEKLSQLYNISRSLIVKAYEAVRRSTFHKRYQTGKHFYEYKGV